MKKRLENLRAKMQELGLDGFIVIGKENIRYLTGVIFNSDGEAWLCVSMFEARLVTDHRYKIAAEKKADEFKSFVVAIHVKDGPYERIANFFRKDERVGVAPKTLSLEFYLKLQDEFKDKLLIVRDENSLIEDLIAHISESKDSGEIEDLKASLAITEKIFREYVLPLVRPGVSELEIAKIISVQNILLAEGNSFDPIVLSGENTSMPHGRPSDRVIQTGDHVQFDFGCIKDLKSDFSRVVFVGEPSDEQARMFKVLLAAQQAAQKAARVGMLCSELHKVADDVVVANGYQPISHGLGHGIGIRTHCRPHISPKAPDGWIIKSGSVFTVEPGIYIKDWGGMRIENMIHVTDAGVNVLNKYPDDMIVV